MSVKLIATMKRKKPNHSISARRKLFLLDRPLSQLPANTLPSNGQVLRYVQFLKSPLSSKFQPHATHAGCSQEHGGSDLSCKREAKCSSIHRCATSAVTDIWISAGFEDFILTGKAIKNRIVSLCKKYKTLVNSNNSRLIRNGKKSQEQLTNLEEKFVNESAELFDIAVKGFEKKIQSNSLISEKDRLDDLKFYHDQKKDRKMIINLSDPDIDLERRTKEAMIRKDRENFQARYKKEDSNADEEADHLDSEGSDCSDVSFGISEGANFDDSEEERLDKSFKRQSKSKQERKKLKTDFPKSDLKALNNDYK